MIYLYGNHSGGKKMEKRTRRIRKPVDPLAGKRSSTRLRLSKHELVFIDRITPEEFEEQKKEFTVQQVEALYNSKEYKKMRRQKGAQKEKWNWQANESKYGAQTYIGSDFDIISNYAGDTSSNEDAHSTILTTMS